MTFSHLIKTFLAASVTLSTYTYAHDLNAPTDSVVSLSAHTHGHATLTLVVEGNEMQLAFQSPAQSILGFEHKPKTSLEQQEIQAAIETFNRADWFVFNSEASCDVTASESSTDLTDVHSGHSHADFYANYQVLCQSPTRLRNISLNIFPMVPALEKIEVQWIINGQQGASEASLGKNSISF